MSLVREANARDATCRELRSHQQALRLKADQAHDLPLMPLCSSAAVGTPTLCIAAGKDCCCKQHLCCVLVRRPVDDRQTEAAQEWPCAVPIRPRIGISCGTFLFAWGLHRRLTCPIFPRILHREANGWQCRPGYQPVLCWLPSRANKWCFHSRLTPANATVADGTSSALALEKLTALWTGSPARSRSHITRGGHPGRRGAVDPHVVSVETAGQVSYHRSPRRRLLRSPARCSVLARRSAVLCWVAGVVLHDVPCAVCDGAMRATLYNVGLSFMLAVAVSSSLVISFTLGMEGNCSCTINRLDSAAPLCTAATLHAGLQCT